MIEVTLHGCDIARAEGIEVKARGNAGPIGSLARKLIDAGHSGDAVVTVKRGDTVCFEPASLQAWASKQCREGDRYSAKMFDHVERDYTPYTETSEEETND